MIKITELVGLARTCARMLRSLQRHLRLSSRNSAGGSGGTSAPSLFRENREMAEDDHRRHQLRAGPGASSLTCALPGSGHAGQHPDV
jgi:hypothetical protein